MISMDISLAPLTTSHNVLVANLAGDKPLTALNEIEKNLLGVSDDKTLGRRLHPGALFIIFPRDIDSVKPVQRQIKEDDIE